MVTYLIWETRTDVNGSRLAVGGWINSIINKVFDRKATVEKFVAYLHGLYQIPGCPRYNGEKITFCNLLQLLPIDNNAMLVAS